MLIAAGAFEPFYFKVLVTDREPLRRSLIELPYRRVPGLRTFLADVAARTHNGDTIAIVTPFTRWEGGYDYCYARSLYPLAGRTVIPLLDPDDRFHPERLSRANYVAAYRQAPTFPGFAMVARMPDGTLLQRQP